MDIPTMNGRRIAVMKLSALGDIASTLPYLRAMDPPPCIITSPIGKAFLKDEFSDFIVLDKKSAISQIQVILEVRKRRFTDILDFQGNKRCRLIGRLSGSRVHDVANVFVRNAPASELTASVLKKGREQHQFRKRERTHIIFNTGSSPKWTSKRPSVEKWQEFASILNDRYNLPIKLVGSEEEVPYVEEIAKALPGKIEVLAGKTSFPELKKVIRDAFLTVSTDSAALHISKAEGTPTIGIFGSHAIGGKMSFPWTVGIYDRVLYPDGKLPIAQQEPGNYYDHVDLREGLDALAEYLH
ncbi:glycosyltransferase family 9 protein [Haloferula chungangensis]|uniref:Glycosyltransferase family 9 protein n=1 Tax=Haloferula chungangensis TaxID=1048331 RepID=A0ABW2L6X8_9BACT